ncbi:hypothetical protein [Sphingobacterium paucimobilis]|uniref:Uncharacterized protein n=1 Tax=Sphingobacterium paucimobilis HER1398 TaxID=1346330 RepID=U2HVD9_9SPHI|nr:hypothetical protein [Sphingobacterium paucimobilis]ERJ59245.1 hypothetical protein M472_10715 [Sphingobacterium paucimobilis HER1398]
MKKNKRVWLIAVPIILILGYLIWDSFSQPTIKDIPGDFTEVAFVRNEQNKGGIIRIYAVTVGDLQNAKFDACADLFPTNDYNSVTRIFFFDKNQPYPTALQLEAPYYDTTAYKAINIVKRSGSK